MANETLKANTINPYVEKWKHMPPLERTIMSLEQKRLRREKAIVRYQTEIIELTKAIEALYAVKQG